MPTPNIDLSDHQAHTVEKLASSGRREDLHLAALRAAAQTGISDIDAGSCHSFASANALDEHLAKLTTDVLSA